MVQTRQFEEGAEYGDKYIGEMFSFAVNKAVVYVFGQLAAKRLERKIYKDYLDDLAKRGFTKMIYDSKGRPRADLGGFPLYYYDSGEFKQLENLWVKNLEAVAGDVQSKQQGSNE